MRAREPTKKILIKVLRKALGVAMVLVGIWLGLIAFFYYPWPQNWLLRAAVLVLALAVGVPGYCLCVGKKV